MPDLIEELRRYADAAEAAMPERPMVRASVHPTPPRMRTWLGPYGLMAAAAAIAVIAVFGLTASDRPISEVEATDEAAVADDDASTEAGDEAETWELERIGVVDHGIDSMAWFGGRWWAAGHWPDELLTSSDGATWTEVETPFGTEGLWLSLIANDSHLLVTGFDPDGQVLAAVTEDGILWEVNTVTSYEPFSAGRGTVVPFAFEDDLGVATQARPSGNEAAYDAVALVLERLEQLALGQKYRWSIDPETRALRAHLADGREVSGPLSEFGLTEAQADLVIDGYAAHETPTGGFEWQLHLSGDGSSWERADLPEGVARIYAGGQAAVAVEALGQRIDATVDGRRWVDISELAVQPNRDYTSRATGRPLIATSSSDLWSLAVESPSGQPVLRGDSLEGDFEPTGLSDGIQLAQAGSAIAVLVDDTPDGPPSSELDGPVQISYQLRVAVLVDDGDPQYIDLPDLPASGAWLDWIASIYPGPDGTFVVHLLSAVVTDSTTPYSTQTTAYLIQRS